MRIRSVLFAPGNRADVLAKLPRSSPDVAVLDLEDAVPAASKAEAREIVRQAIAGLIADAPELTLTVRVNAVPSEWFAADVDGLPGGLTSVVIPKIETLAHLEQARAAMKRAGLGGVGIIAGIETALGVERCVELLAGEAVVAAYFGAEDFIADMGGVRTATNIEVQYARSRMALAGRLAGVPVVDQIVADFGDETRFVAEAAEARALGFSGKLCIHPTQVALANVAFVPTPAEIERASALLAAYGDAVAQGRASIAFDGQMVDEPVARQARALLDRRDGPRGTVGGIG